MKKYILISLLFTYSLICNAQSKNFYSYSISMKVSGSQIFKPIQPSTISINRLNLGHNTLLYDKVIITNDKTLKSLLSFIQQSDLDKKEIIKGKSDFGCFKILIYDKRKIVKTYYLNSEFDSKNYLKKVIYMLIINKLDKSVVSWYQFVLSQLNYPPNM